MANGYNPYNVAQSGQNLLETLLSADQQTKQGQMAIGQHKGEMGEKFQKEQIASQKEQERLLNKQRKPGFLEQVAPLLGLIPGVGTIAGAALSGLAGMYRAKQQSKFAEKQIGKAKGAGLDKAWGETFLGGKAREIGAAKDTMLDQMLEQTKVSGSDLLNTGLTEGIKGYAMGSMGEGIGKTVEGVKEGSVVAGKAAKGVKAVEKSGLEMTKLGSGKGVTLDATGAIENIDITKMTDIELDKLGELGKKLGTQDYESTIRAALDAGGQQTLMQSLFSKGGAFGQDPSTLIGEDSQGGKVLQNLMLIQSMLGNRGQ